MRMVRREDREYPARLLKIPGPPKILYVLGELPREDIPSVAVIGARDCSEYGKYVAAGLGKYLGEQGIQVISGMARGIDGISQEAALDAGGKSFGILGCGVDICYPAGNRTLYEKLKREGGLLSEYEPGTPVKPYQFPARNRIVSGLADAVVVVEAREKSGTLITVDMALEQGKEVYAVPGRVTDRLSDGCNRLLKTGAGLLLHPGEFVEELWENFQKQREWGDGAASHGTIPDMKKRGKEESYSAVTGTIPGMKKKEKIVNNDATTGFEHRIGKNDERKLEEEPDEELWVIYEALDFAPCSVAEITEKVNRGRVLEKREPEKREPEKLKPEKLEAEKLGERQIASGLVRLCMKGLALQVSPGQFCLRKS